MNARPPLESLLSSRSFRAPECPSLFAKLTMQERSGANAGRGELVAAPGSSDESTEHQTRTAMQVLVRLEEESLGITNPFNQINRPSAGETANFRAEE